MRNCRNPSLILSDSQVDDIIDKIYSKDKIDPKLIADSNLLLGDNLHEYVSSRWPASRRNHTTMRTNSLRRKLRDAMGTHRTQMFVYKISVELKDYSSIIVGHVPAKTSDSALNIAKLVYGHVMFDIPSKRVIATAVGSGSWDQASILNRESLKSIEEYKANKKKTIENIQAALEIYEKAMTSLTVDVSMKKDEDEVLCDK